MQGYRSNHLSPSQNCISEVERGIVLQTSVLRMIPTRSLSSLYPGALLSSCYWWTVNKYCDHKLSSCILKKRFCTNWECATCVNLFVPLDTPLRITGSVLCGTWFRFLVLPSCLLGHKIHEYARINTFFLLLSLHYCSSLHLRGERGKPWCWQHFGVIQSYRIRP